MIAKNQAIKRLRKDSRVSLEETSEVERRREALGGSRAVKALALASDGELMLLINRLPDPQRQAIVLRYVLDFTGPEIGELLGRSPESVRQLLSRGLAFLRERLVALGREPNGRQRHSMQRLPPRFDRIRRLHGVTLLR